MSQTTSRLHVQVNMSALDLDLGSGGTLILPDQPGAHPHEAIIAGKNGTIYLVDRDNMGHYNPNNDNQIVQFWQNVFPGGTLTTGNFKAPPFLRSTCISAQMPIQSRHSQ